MKSGPRRVLVTGAGGFIGGRVVEVLHQLEGWIPRAGVRRWANAPRVARMPVEVVPCDVLDDRQISAAVRGVDAVVHCAVAGREVIVEGTRRTLDASLTEGVSRFVHLSTVDVYGKAEGLIEEDHALESTGREYGDSKIEAEAHCRSLLDRGLPVTILRPTIVYGPFSDLWTIEFADRMLANRWHLPEADCSGICNLLYVDDLVRSIIRAMEEQEAVGEAFNISGPDHPTWNEYFQALADELELTLSPPSSSSVSRGLARLAAPFRTAAKFTWERYQEPILAISARFPALKDVLQKAESAVRRTPTPQEFDLYSRVVRYSTEKARTILSYRPWVGMERGIDLSVAWLRHHGYLRRSSKDVGF